MPYTNHTVSFNMNSFKFLLHLLIAKLASASCTYDYGLWMNADRTYTVPLFKPTEGAGLSWSDSCPPILSMELGTMTLTTQLTTLSTSVLNVDTASFGEDLESSTILTTSGTGVLSTTSNDVSSSYSKESDSVVVTNKGGEVATSTTSLQSSGTEIPDDELDTTQLEVHCVNSDDGYRAGSNELTKLTANFCSSEDIKGVKLGPNDMITKSVQTSTASWEFTVWYAGSGNGEEEEITGANNLCFRTISQIWRRCKFRYMEFWMIV